jgi:hypothetical protein
MMTWKLLAALPIAAGLLVAPMAQAGPHDRHGGHVGARHFGGFHAGGGRWAGGHWGGWRGHGGGGNAAAAIIGGLVGLGLGAALANQYPAYAPPPVAYPPYYGY